MINKYIHVYTKIYIYINVLETSQQLILQDFGSPMNMTILHKYQLISTSQKICTTTPHA